MRWMKSLLQGGVAGKTVAMDGKTVLSTDKLTKDRSVQHIFLYSMSPIRFSTPKNSFPVVHTEKAYGSATHTRDYV